MQFNVSIIGEIICNRFVLTRNGILLILNNTIMYLKKFSWLFGLAFLLNVFPVTFMSCSDDEIPQEKPQNPDIPNDGDEESIAFKKSCRVIMERITNANMASNATGVDNAVNEWLALMKENGSFSDINYSDKSYSWEPGTHLDRLKQMAQAYVLKKSSYYRNTELHKNIVNALTYWNTVHPVCNNWYKNQIFAPQKMGEILILLRSGEKQISKELEDSILAYMKKTGGNPAEQAGANETDIALHWLYRGCLKEDKEVLDAAVLHTFAPLTYVGVNEPGIQYDLSYFQHGPQLYIGGYGPIMLNGVTRVADYTAGTGYKLSDSQVDILHKFTSDTYMKSIRGNVQFYNVAGRSVSRPNALFCRGFANTLEKMKLIDPVHVVEYERDIDILREKADYSGINETLTHYYIGDCSIFQGKKYSVGIRMASNRTRRCEHGNGENLKGFFMSDGSMNIAVEGNEYLDIFPVWDWCRIPGVTAPQLSEMPMAAEWGEPGESDYCGGLSDGKNGLAGFKMAHKTYGVDVSANKSCFFMGDEVVCLGSGISSNMSYKVNTTVEQCLLEGNVCYSTDGQELAVSKGMELTDQKLDWVWHRNIGYFFPESQKVSVKAETRSGCWYDINNTQNKNTISKDVCSIWLNHGDAPSDDTYSYILVPGIKSVNEVKNYDIRDIKILANTTEIQSVGNSKTNVIQAMFYKKGTIAMNDLKITVDNPCALMLRKISENVFDIYFSDPSHKLKSLSITIEYGDKKKEYFFSSFDEDNVHRGKTHLAQLSL